MGHIWSRLFLQWCLLPTKTLQTPKWLWVLWPKVCIWCVWCMYFRLNVHFIPVHQMHVTDYASVDNLRCHVPFFTHCEFHHSSPFLPLLSAGGIKSRLLTSDPACWSFIMQMMANLRFIILSTVSVTFMNGKTQLGSSPSTYACVSAADDVSVFNRDHWWACVCVLVLGLLEFNKADGPF